VLAKPTRCKKTRFPREHISTWRLSVGRRGREAETRRLHRIYCTSPAYDCIPSLLTPLSSATSASPFHGMPNTPCSGRHWAKELDYRST
jgi:hypothetical protein